jgi:hypothetical protein
MGMKTIQPSYRGQVSHVIGDLLLLVLFIASLAQIGLCLDAGRSLLQPAPSCSAIMAGPVLGTNVPVHVLPSAGFPSSAKRG